MSNPENSTPQEQPQDENSVIAERRAKLETLRASGTAFPNDFERSDLADALHQRAEHFSADQLAESPIETAVAGRMMLKRVMGKASFATLQDMSGRIQVYVSKEAIGDDAYEAFKHFDLGDIVGAAGTLFRTKTGELSVRVSSIRLLTKSIRPLPDKFHGLHDQEQKYRARYLDLIANSETRQTFMTRSHVIQGLREFLIKRGFLEVETPMMHPIPGGAAAKPFATHHNALDMPLYLRIAPELYLKRLVVGGFEKVFEINRNFRNEGLSPRHNPEFTMLEFYEAYRDYRHLMDLTEAMFRELAQSVLGSTAFEYQGRTLDFGKPFQRLTAVEAVLQARPDITREMLDQRETVEKLLKDAGEEPDATVSLAALHLALFEAVAEENLFEPTFIIDYPAEVSPLARSNDADPSITERFELYIAGREIANGFSELNDPDDQAARFKAQADRKATGDEEAMHYDADYIKALEYGLPPTAGEGIGIDRLVMLFTNSANIRDVILFPHMRPQG